MMMYLYLYFVILLLSTTTTSRSGVKGFSVPSSSLFLSSSTSSSRISSRRSNTAIRASTTNPTTTSPSTTTATSYPHPRIDIDENFKGLEKIHSNPDIFIIHNFLDKHYCDDLITKASEKKMKQSPVAYAGKFDDVKELLGLAAKGPVAWFSIISAWFQVTQLLDNNSAAGYLHSHPHSQQDQQFQFFIHLLQNYTLSFLIAAVGIYIFIKSREEGLQDLRTSTSTTLDDLNVESTLQFVKRSADLFNIDTTKQDPARQAMYFEAPTVIRYEAGQSLAPHYDANRSAETEDANRGGQTLATLLLYLNDVSEGGKTRFGLISSSSSSSSSSSWGDGGGKLVVQPKVGDALLFFPADREGGFDDRLEHEGCPAIDTKWIARIWRHIDRVPPPFGLSNSELLKL